MCCVRGNHRRPDGSRWRVPEYGDRHGRQTVPFDSRNQECARPKIARSPGSPPKRALPGRTPETPRLAPRLNQLSRVTASCQCAFVALDELRTRAPQQEMTPLGIAAQLTLDDEAEARRQIAVQQHTVDIAGVIGDHHAAIRRAGCRCRES